MTAKRVFLMAMLFSTPLAAAVPNRITYQGRLTKSGISAAGDHNFVACLKNGSTVLWCDSGQTHTLPPSGDFTLTLEPTVPVDWLNNTIQLELRINGQLLSPNDLFTAVPYALVAATATSALTATTAASAQALSNPLPADQVQLNGTSAFLDTWQSTTTPSQINASKIQGPFTSQILAQSGIAMSGTKISGLAAATGADEAVRLDQLPTVFVPAGTVSMYAGAAVPAGYLLCDGSAVSRTTYAALFSAIGTTFGPGNGSSTFNLPDMRGIFPKGAGTTNRPAGVDASGNPYATALGSYSQDKMQGHIHDVQTALVGLAGGPSSTANIPFNAGGGPYVTGSPISDSTNGAPRTGHTTEPQSLGLNYIIKH